MPLAPVTPDCGFRMVRCLLLPPGQATTVHDGLCRLENIYSEGLSYFLLCLPGLLKLVRKRDQTFLVFECCLLSFSESMEGVLVARADVTGPEREVTERILRTSFNLYHWIFIMPFPFPQSLVTTILVWDQLFYEINFFFSFYPTYKWYHPILVFHSLAYFT